MRRSILSAPLDAGGDLGNSEAVPIGKVPPQHASEAPRQRAAGKVPNPRRPGLVRDIHGNELGDLFLMFPDLPRPARPPARLFVRRSLRRV